MSSELTNQTMHEFTFERPLLMAMIVWIALVGSPLATAQTSLNKEAKVKAAYLFNFTKYIEWPDSSFASASSPVFICVDRNPNLEAFMRALVKAKKVGKQQRLLQVNSLEKADKCHLSYLKEYVDSSTKVLLGSVNVSEKNNQFEHIAIKFFRQNGKLRFEFRMKEIERLNVSISSELLKLARIN